VPEASTKSIRGGSDFGKRLLQLARRGRSATAGARPSRPLCDERYPAGRSTEADGANNVVTHRVRRREPRGLETAPPTHPLGAWALRLASSMP
jgi:hypothetical protein